MMVVVVRLFLLVVMMLSKMVEVMASEYDDPKDSRVKLKKNQIIQRETDCCKFLQSCPLSVVGVAGIALGH